MLSKVKALVAKANDLLARYRKAIAPAVALAADGIASGFLHGSALTAAHWILAAGAFVGVVVSPANKAKAAK